MTTLDKYTESDGHKDQQDYPLVTTEVELIKINGVEGILRHDEGTFSYPGLEVRDNETLIKANPEPFKKNIVHALELNDVINHEKQGAIEDM